MRVSFSAQVIQSIENINKKDRDRKKRDKTHLKYYTYNICPQQFYIFSHKCIPLSFVF